MGTITARRRKDGSIRYTAQIRIKRDGKIIHTEAETFGARTLAKEWMRRRESELDQRRARGDALGKSKTLGTLIGWYREAVKKHADWGRTKETDLTRIEGYPIAKKIAAKLTAQDFLEHIEWRRESGAGPATAGNDLIWIRQVLRSAKVSEDKTISLEPLEGAVVEARNRKLIAKSKQRDRRVLPGEEEKLMAYFTRSGNRSKIPMADLFQFALHTSRREEEITRMKWKDLDRENGIAWLDDVKHPRKKKGNRRKFRMLTEAWKIIDQQPETGEFVFPYNPQTVGEMFRRACKFLGIEDLHFHDARHEATSRFFERGYAIQEVAQFTLHESWATLKRYTHLKPENIPEKMKK